MSSLIKSSAMRTIDLGILVSRATATLPQTAAGNIFLITGGRVLVTSIIGQVTTVIQNQANVTKLQSVPTVGSTVDLSATVDIANLEAGGLLGLTTAQTATPFSLALAKQLAGAIPLDIGLGVIIATGAIALNCGASNTGSVKWDLTYIPYDTGASVAAA
jgi:hypothetical protein